MPRRSILSAAERDALLALPDAKDELIRHYTLNEAELSLIRQHRGSANRLGFAIQLCYMRYPGITLAPEIDPWRPLLFMVAHQLQVPHESWIEYAQRAETRREHLLELQSIFGFQSFTTTHHYRPAVRSLDELAWQTDKGIVLATSLVNIPSALTACGQLGAAGGEGIADVFDEDEAEYQVLVFGRVHVGAQLVGGGPESFFDVVEH